MESTSQHNEWMRISKIPKCSGALQRPPEDSEDWEFLEEIGPSRNSLELQMSPGAHCFSKVLRRVQVLQRAPESSGACTASKKKEFSEFLFYFTSFLFYYYLIYSHFILIFIF